MHKGRNITERLPKRLHVQARGALRQAWELDDADKAGLQISVDAVKELLVACKGIDPSLA